MRKISPEAVAAIQYGTWTTHDNHGVEELHFVMPNVDRKVYQEVARLCENYGGKWSRKAKATVFSDMEAEALLQQACCDGHYVDAQQFYQFFPTPPDVADHLVQVLQPPRGGVVLEPSAGDGALVLALARQEPALRCVALDVDPARVVKLMTLNTPISFNLVVQKCDFMEYKHPFQFDAVLMNPPFSKSQDMQHVRQALKMLRTGGRLVSVMCTGFQYRQNRAAREFREWLNSWPHTINNLPSGSFKASGTSVETAVLEIVKTR